MVPALLLLLFQWENAALEEEYFQESPENKTIKMLLVFSWLNWVLPVTPFVPL